MRLGAFLKFAIDAFLGRFGLQVRIAIGQVETGKQIFDRTLQSRSHRTG